MVFMSNTFPKTIGLEYRRQMRAIIVQLRSKKMKFGNLLVTIVVSLLMHSSLSHASFTFSNVTYTANSVTFTIDGDMTGHAEGNDSIGFSLVYAGDIMMPGDTATNTWSRSVFDNKTILQLGFTDDFIAGDYTWSKYGASLQDASVNNATVTVSFSLPHLNESAVSPSITFVWGIGPAGTALGTVIPTLGAPPPATFSVGGTVSGLTGSVTLQNNGGDDIIKTTNDSFTFTAQAEGSDYAVTVSSQPTGQTCTVTNGSGTNITANITNVTVTCVTDEVPTYTVGGTVSGLTGSVTLQNNGGDDIIKTTNDGFTFTAQVEGSDYAVTVSSQPTGQTCTVTNGSGTNITANITNVTVTCVDDVVVVPPTPALPVPTMSQWALIMLSMFLGLMVFANRRRLF